MSHAKPPLNVTMETTPVICGRCRQELTPLVIEEIGGLAQISFGNVLVRKLEVNCRLCGAAFRWDIREQDMEKMTVTYHELLEHFKGYNPE